MKLSEQLNDPSEAYPGNFTTAKRANALLLCLCQDAAILIDDDEKVLRAALNALELPCDRWNKEQALIVKAAIETLYKQLEKHK